MAEFVVHHQGVFNLYNSISDAPVFTSGVTETKLKRYFLRQYGESGLRTLEPRLIRAREQGTSCRLDDSLQETIAANRAGPNESRVSYEEFIAKFLTLPT